MQSDLLLVFEQLNQWFKSNQISSYWILTKLILFNFLKIIKCTSGIQIKYEDKKLSLANETKYNGLFLIIIFPEKKKHIECIKPKLSSDCFAMRLVKPFVTTHTLRIIYYSYFHSVMTYCFLSGGTAQTE